MVPILSLLSCRALDLVLVGHGAVQLVHVVLAEADPAVGGLRGLLPAGLAAGEGAVGLTDPAGVGGAGPARNKWKFVAILRRKKLASSKI